MIDPAASVAWTDPSIWSPAAFANLARAGDDRWAALEPGPGVLVVAHDAGGAEVVGAWLKRRLTLAAAGRAARLEPVLHLAGPAQKVFARLELPELPAVRPEAPFASGRAIDWVLSGTGWSTQHETRAMQDAIARGIPACAFLDHWTNYPVRFSLGAETIHPTYLWVGDVWAESLARDHFGDRSDILLMPSAHFAAIRGDYEQAPRVPDDPPARYLYVTEPIGSSAQAQFGDERWYGYTEFEALENFLQLVEGAPAGPKKTIVRLRPHPAEPPDKFGAILARHVGVQLSPPGTSLLQDCTWSDAVVGCKTMAMVIGWLCGRQILCSIPSTGPECDLPLPAIRRLFPRQNRAKNPAS